MSVFYPLASPARHHDGSHSHPPWPSPGYSTLVTYNGLGGPQHPNYSSPTTLSQNAVPLRPQSTTPQQPLTHHWQQQLIKYESSRSSSAPHHRARTSAMTIRNTTKAAITITDPNHRRAQASISSERTDSSSGESENRVPTPVANGHPSSTAAPVVASPPPIARLAAVKPSEGNHIWTTLDMGGMRLKNLSASLFKLTYLTTLYINHNALTSLSPSISQLRNLVLLDVSSNQLTSLPPELGMCTNLKELLAFDNMLEVLPPQLGSLHQLVMLGIEGNPVQANLRAVLQKDGTQALISLLRDSAPVPLPPPERIWKVMPNAVQKANDADPSVETFSLLCYNVLCERYATSTMYGYTPSWALSWDYRKDLIMAEISNYEADILCLQEVDAAQYEDYFMRHLEPLQYEGIFSPKSRARTMPEAQRRLVDGCAIFYKKSKYTLIEQQLIEFNQVPSQSRKASGIMTEDMYNRVLTKDNIAVVALLENPHTGSRLIVANVHIHWDPEYRDVKLVQVASLMAELERISIRFAKLPPRLLDQTNGKVGDLGAPDSAGGASPPSSAGDSSPGAQQQPRKAPTYDDPTKIPTIVCGDFNSIPSSGVYEFLSTGSLPPTHEDFMTYKYGKYTDPTYPTGGGMKHSYSLKSAYATALGGTELPITNYTPSFKGVIDYIWFSNASLSVEAVLGEVDEKYLEKVVGFPNAHFPSDHVCIISEFRVHRPKESTRAAITNGKSSNSTIGSRAK